MPRDFSYGLRGAGEITSWGHFRMPVEPRCKAWMWVAMQPEMWSLFHLEVSNVRGLPTERVV